MNKNIKTLKISIFEKIQVSDKYKEKSFQNYMIQKTVFTVFVDFVIRTLFIVVSNYSRPPTFVKYNYLQYLKTAPFLV